MRKVVTSAALFPLPPGERVRVRGVRLPDAPRRASPSPRPSPRGGEGERVGT
ncbi:hypothetical protein [Azospirillum melinis]